MLTLVMRMVAIDSGGLGIAHAEHSPIGIHYHRSGVYLCISYFVDEEDRDDNY